MLQRFRSSRTREALRRALDETRLRLGVVDGAHWLALSETHRLPQAMINPLLHCLPGEDCPNVLEISRKRAQSSRPWRHANPTAVLLQSWFDTPREELERLLDDVRGSCPDTTIVWLDWYAPLHIPQPWLLERVDVYVKKHLLRDRARYVAGLHDTNLVEYEAQFDPSLLLPRDPGIEQSLLDEKLFAGWNFAMAPRLRRALDLGVNPASPRQIAVHFRCAIGGSPWYTHMRERSLAAARELPIRPSLISEQNVSQAHFWRELVQSRLCISPFGYGEVCWRDFEAIAAGALLVKPDMSHLETYPDIYRPFETYVPVAWDWSDLEERCVWALKSEDRRIQICRNAAEVWQGYVTTGWAEHFQALKRKMSE